MKIAFFQGTKWGAMILLMVLIAALSGCFEDEDAEDQAIVHNAVAALPAENSSTRVFPAPQLAMESTPEEITAASPAPESGKAAADLPAPVPHRSSGTSPAPEPEHAAAATPKPEPAHSSATTPSPEPAQSSATTPSPEPAQSSATTPSPEPAQSSATTPSPVPTPEIAMATVPPPTPPVINTPAPVPSTPATPDLSTVITETVQEQINQTGAKHVDLVLCLDVSGSMDFLIESAKQKLREIANTIRKQDPQPTLRIALISYGSKYYDPRAGWVRVESDFTEDTGLLYNKLSRLKAWGENEYVARVIQVSLDRLNWSSQPDVLRTIFIAGNETIYQDPQISINQVCQRARARDININTIYCANFMEDSREEWRALARTGAGKYALIDFDNTINVGFPIPMPSGFPNNSPIKLPVKFPTNFPFSFPNNSPQNPQQGPVQWHIQ